MIRKKVFISSVQSEFIYERQMLFDYLTSDALLGIYFDPFIFENVPALNTSPASVFLNEVENCDIYIGIFGSLYGYQDAEGISPTEREYVKATLLNKVRFVYVKKTEQRELKEKLLVKKAESVIIRKGFSTYDELRTAIYASLINYLIENEYIRTSPFDATFHTEADITDLNEETIRDFVGMANRIRSFPFSKNSDINKVLTHLNLIKDKRVTNAALLLFNNRPQRYFISSEIRCAHFHGLTATKPIPSYKVYKGNVFEMIASAVDFVLSKLNLYTGDRSKNIQVEVQYDLPVAAVTEAIVNAVAHRDYSSNASVQVMLFPDRLEVLNPGRLPVGLTIEELYLTHRSIPVNPLLAESLYLYGIIERMGTGTGDILESCSKMGLKRPVFKQGSGFEVVLYRKSVNELMNSKDIPQVTHQVTPQATPQVTHQATSLETPQVTYQVTPQVTPQPTPQVIKLLTIIENELSTAEILKALQLSDRKNVREAYISSALKMALIEPTYNNPNHPKQKYRLTPAGREYVKYIKI